MDFQRVLDIIHVARYFLMGDPHLDDFELRLRVNLFIPLRDYEYFVDHVFYGERFVIEVEN